MSYHRLRADMDAEALRLMGLASAYRSAGSAVLADSARAAAVTLLDARAAMLHHEECAHSW